MSHDKFIPVDGVELRLHMGIGAGDLDEFYVGGHNGKFEYFVAGEPIEQMSDATEEATHGQLVLSTHAYDLLKDDEETQRAKRQAAIALLKRRQQEQERECSQRSSRGSAP